MKKLDAHKEFLSVGEISARSGIAVSAIHFYEEKGLIRSHRNSGNQRRFHRHELRILSYIKVAQTVGLSLNEIKEALKAIENKEKPSVTDWKNLGKSWKKVLTKRIQLMEKLKDQLHLCIGCGCLSLEDCPLRNPDDVLFKKGAGPRLIIE